MAAVALMALFVVVALVTFAAGTVVARARSSRRAAAVAAMAAIAHAAGASFFVSEALHRPGAAAAYVYGALAIGAAVLAVGALARRPQRALAAIASGAVLAILFHEHQPWERHGVCLEEDLPGATSRYRELILVACGDPRVQWDRVGADYALVRFLGGDPPMLRLVTSSVECSLDPACAPSDERYRLVRDQERWRLMLEPGRP